MNASVKSSLQSRLTALHEERVRTWAPDQLALNVNQRRLLVETADPAGFVKAGDRVAAFELHSVEGGVLTLDDLTAAGPAVLVFFRYAGCPVCNIALPYYEEALAPKLRELGVSLTAVSPQVPERLGEIKTRHGLSFNVASDGNALGRRFNILYTADEANQAASRAKGGFIGDVTGTGTWELPMPAVIVIGQDHVVAFADVSPDWLSRTEAEPVIEAVRRLVQARVPAA